MAQAVDEKVEAFLAFTNWSKICPQKFPLSWIEPNKGVIMEVTEIVRQLEESELLPKNALKAAIEQREEVTPVFLKILENSAAGLGVAKGVRGSLLLLLHLLAEFGEEKAFPLLINFLRSDPNELEEELGDAITETLPRVLISLFDGDIEILKNLILDPEVDQFVRCAGIEALAYLTRIGKIDRQDTENFLWDCQQKFPKDEDDYVWVGWESAIALLGLESLAPAVKEAFLTGLIPRYHMSFHDFESDMWFTLENPESMAQFEREQLRPFNNTVEEFSWWYGFSEEYWKQIHAKDSGPLHLPLQNEPRSNPLRKIGRNDPCPCGSGKKYKRCCLN